MNKRVINAGLGAGTVPGIATLVELVLERVGQVQAAMSIKEFFTINSAINWQPIWLLLFVFCALMLIMYNIEFFLVLGVWLFSKPLFMNGSSAVTYIAYWSEVGSSWPTPLKQSEALAALKDAALKRRVRLRGRPYSGMEIEGIPASAIADCQLMVVPSDALNSQLVLLNSKQDMIYAGIVAHQSQVRKCWKNNRNTQSFTGWNRGDD